MTLSLCCARHLSAHLRIFLPAATLTILGISSCQTASRIPPTATPTVTSAATSTLPSPPTPTEFAPSPTTPPTTTPMPITPPGGSTNDVPPLTLAISEVAFDVCGDASYDRTSEFIELFNYGDQPVDLHSLWISSGNPQPIEPWLEANPFTYLSPSDKAHQSSWLLPPSSFGLILGPQYPLGKVQYDIPASTYLFSIDRDFGLVLGGPYGFVGSADDIKKRDVLILYLGNDARIDRLVSSYGTPRVPVEKADPRKVVDDGIDAYPAFQGDCITIERRVPSMPDTDLNWRRSARLGGTAGYIPTPQP